MILKIDWPIDLGPLTKTCSISYVSFNDGFSLCLEISSNPNLEILAICILALSEDTALLKAFSTLF